MRDSQKGYESRDAKPILIVPKLAFTWRMIVKQKLPGPVLADPSGTVSATYGLAFQNQFRNGPWSSRPAVLVIDRDGLIRYIGSHDDHDIRDDWNTSAAWRAEMEKEPWWRDRIRAGLASYWVYQHLGNLSPAELADDQDYQRLLATEGDTWPHLADLADRADQEVDCNKGLRFSYRWDLGRSRLGLPVSLAPGATALAETTVAPQVAATRVAVAPESDRDLKRVPLG